MIKVFNYCYISQELLSLLPSMQKGEPSWQELKMFGAGWWINNINILKRTIEKVKSVKMLYTNNYYHGGRYLMGGANSEYSNQTVQLHSLIRVFPVCKGSQ